MSLNKDSRVKRVVEWSMPSRESVAEVKTKDKGRREKQKRKLETKDERTVYNRNKEQVNK